MHDSLVLLFCASEAVDSRISLIIAFTNTYFLLLLIDYDRKLILLEMQAYLVYSPILLLHYSVCILYPCFVNNVDRQANNALVMMIIKTGKRTRKKMIAYAFEFFLNTHTTLFFVSFFNIIIAMMSLFISIRLIACISQLDDTFDDILDTN